MTPFKDRELDVAIKIITCSSERIRLSGVRVNIPDNGVCQHQTAPSRGSLAIGLPDVH
jgi:hypothetical protein